MRYEVLADTRFISTGTIVDVIPASQVLAARERVEVNGPETLTLVVPSTLDSPLVGDRVINVVEDNGDAREWRIGKLTRQRTESGVTTTADCQGIRSDLLRFSPIVTQLQANGDRWSHIEWVGLTSTQLWEAVWDCFDDDPDSVSYFAKGTCPNVGSDQQFDFVLDWETQGSALVELATVLGLEVDVQASSTSYVVNLSTGINSTLTAPLIAFRRNQLSVKYVEDHSKTATRVYPRALGDDAFKPTIGELLTRPTFPGGSSGQTGTVDIPTYEDDQLVGLYLEYAWSTALSPMLIEDSTASTGTETGITISTGHTGSPGERHLRLTSTGQRLIYIPRASTARVKSVLLERQDIPAITNLVQQGVNPGSSAYTAQGVRYAITTSNGATSTSVAGPSPFVHLGDTSMHATLPSTDSRVVVGIGNHRVSDEKPHMSCQWSLYLVSGSVGVTMGAGDFGDGVLFPSSTAGGVGAVKASAVDSWHDQAIAPGAYDFTEHSSAIGTSPHWFKLTFSNQSTEQTEFYLDAIQLVNEPVPAEQIVDGSAPRKLWNAGIEELRSGIDQPAKLYDIDAIDLGRLSSGTYPGEAFQYGQSVTLFDPGIGITDSRRIKARVRDFTVEGDTRLELFDVG